MFQILRTAILALAVITLVACSSPTTNSTAMGNVSSDMAVLGADLNQNQTSEVQANMVDESSSTADANTSASGNVTLARSATPSFSVTVTVTHTNEVTTPKPTPFQNGDVVQITRSWTNANGEAVSDTITRPVVPSLTDFSSSVVYTPSAGTSGISTTGIQATYSSSANTWTLQGSETKTINGITLSEVNYTWTFADATFQTSTDRVGLTQITKSGEQVGPYFSNVKLNTTIWYTYSQSLARDVEFLRAIDFISASQVVKRQVYAWAINPSFASTSSTLPSLYDSTASGTTSATSLSFLPTLAVDPTSITNPATVDFWYYSDPTVALSGLSPVYTGTSLASYPKLDISKWTGSVLQQYGPRIADWYEPVAASGVFNGSYVRRVEITMYDGATNNQTVYYSLTGSGAGTTVVNTQSTQVFRTASNGTLTTTKKFSDGLTSTVSITPTYNSAGGIEGYVINRRGTIYTITYTKDASGNVTVISVTDSATGTTTNYTPASNGTWTAS